MSRTYNCENGCCSIKVRVYNEPRQHHFRRGNCRKSGVFLYDPEQDRVLLVQSRGQLWGPPKGTLEVDRQETSRDCAVREVKEETGLDILPENFTRAIKVKNRALYYYMEHKTTDVEVQHHENYEKNDANGITWIKIECLAKCIEDGHIILNQHCKIMFEQFMNKKFGKTDFVPVINKRKRKQPRER